MHAALCHAPWYGGNFARNHFATLENAIQHKTCAQQSPSGQKMTLRVLRHNTDIADAAHRIKPYLGFGVPVGSAYLSARRTFGRPKVRFNPSPPPCFGRKNGRRYGRTFGRPKVRPYLRPAESPAVPSAGRSAGRKYGRTSGWPNWPAESTAVPPAGRVGRPKVRFNPSPPLVVIPPYTNNPPPIY